MEKEYVDALLKDIDRSSSLEEKTHLMTIFISELAKSDEANKKAIYDMKLSLELSAEAAKTFAMSIEVISKRFEELDKYLLTNSRQTLSTAETTTRNTETLVELIEDIGKVHERFSKVYGDISWIMDRIEKPEEK